MLDSAHRKRNLAEYEGFIDIEESGIDELRALVEILVAEVEHLVKSGGT